MKPDISLKGSLGDYLVDIDAIAGLNHTIVIIQINQSRADLILRQLINNGLTLKIQQEEPSL